MLAGNNALKIALILASELCFVRQAAALDLGDLVLESALTEPLDATIALQDVTGVDPSQISVSLGTADDFAAVGIERPEMAEQIQFAVAVEGAAGSIHLTTQDPVAEPFLDLLLIVTWPDGMVQRDYTILLNMANSPTASVGSLVIPGATNGDSPGATATDTTTQNVPGTDTGDGQTYAVVDGDSMWEIAARTRPSSNVSMHQMMLAIQRANEDAFINNNINRVLSGKVLRIPTLQEISLVDQSTAVEQVSQQNQQLSSQPLAVNRSTGNTSPAPEQDQLTVLTDDAPVASGGGASGGLEGTIAALESEMMLSEESRDRARLENAELTSRFKMLEEEMDLLQNLIEAEDARIAQLQASLATQAETTEQALATTEAATDVMAAQQSAPQPGIAANVEGWLQNTAVLMSVIVGLLLLVLGYLFWQRRRMDAAVYAFDSGIPELETAENSTFAPEKKSGGLAGWFSTSGSKRTSKDAEPDFAAAGFSAVATSSAYARAEASDNFNAQQNDAAQHSDYLDTDHADDYASSARSFDREDLPVQTAIAEASGAASALDTRATIADDAALADELIAEAMGADNLADVSHEADAEQKADELAELLVPTSKTPEPAIPETFEFTLTTAPEAGAEETEADISDDIESFDFQLTDNDNEAIRKSAASGLDADYEDSDVNALLLDEDEAEFQATAPMNECDTKLDLAVAYEAMGDIEGAIEILDEVITDGDKIQVAEANRLKGLWRNS